LSSIGKVGGLGPMLEGFGIAKYCTYISQGKKIFVAPNAIKHLLELSKNASKLGPEY
jgi:hypothetical protein